MAETGGWLSDMAFWVDGNATSGSGGGGSGQGFQLSQDEARGQLEKFRTIRERLLAVQDKSERLAQTTAPAEDPATVRMNQALVGGSEGQGAFVIGNQSLRHQYEYAHEIVTRLEKALGIYQEADEQASSDMHRTGQNNSSGGFAE